MKEMKEIKRLWMVGFLFFLPIATLLFSPVITLVVGLLFIVFTIVHWELKVGILSAILISTVLFGLFLLPQKYLLILGISAASLGFSILGIGLGQGIHNNPELLKWYNKFMGESYADHGLFLEDRAIEDQRAEMDLQKNSEQYEMITSEIPILVCRFLPDFNITYVNRSYCQYFKKTSEELIGTSILDHVHKRDEATIVAKIKLLTPRKPTLSLDQQVVTPDGDICYLRWIYRGLFNDEKKITAYHCFGEDITAQRQAERRIQERENKYWILFEGSHDAIVIINEQGKFLDCNRQAIKIFGLHSKEELFKYPSSSFSPELQPDGQKSDEAFRKHVSTVLKTDTPIYYEWFYQRIDGEVFPAEIILTSYQLEDDIVLYVSIRDISHHKRAEEAIKMSEEKYRMISHNVSDIIWTMDMDLKYTFVSPSAERHSGYTVEEIMSFRIEDILSPSSFDLVIQVFQEELLYEYSKEELDLERTRTLELEQVCKDGSLIIVEVKMTFLRDQQGNPTGILGITRDITQRKEAEKQIAEKNEVLSLLNGIALEQAACPNYEELMEMLLDQFQKSTEAMIAIFSEYNVDERVLIPKKVKVHERIQKIIIETGDKEIVNHPISISERVYQEIVSWILFSSETEREVIQEVVPKAISEALEKSPRGYHLIGLGHVAEGELYGTSIIVLEEEQKAPSLEFLESFAHIAAISLRRLQAERELLGYTEKIEDLYFQIDEELDKARQVQERLLPRSLPLVEGLSFAAHFQPAQRLGGDFFDIIKIGHRLVIYLSDISGHGLDGCMLSLFVKHTVKSYLSFSSSHEISPTNIIGNLAAQFHGEDYPNEYFICIFLGVLDLETLRMTYAGVGFQDTPYVKMGNGEEIELMSKGLFITNNFPLEMMDIKEDSILLSPGTSIFFNTDGLTEQGEQGSLYGERLPGVFYKNAHQSPELIVQSVLEDFRCFNHGSLQGRDDITFLVLKVEPTLVEV